MWGRLAQIVGLLLCILGLGLVGCTLAMDHWRVAQLGGEGGSSVVRTAWYWSNLWRDCYEDSTAVVHCVDLGVLWRVKAQIQTVRGLLLAGLCLGLTGAVLSFFGMECTRVGGGPRSKRRMLTAAAAVQLAGCVADVAGFGLYINRVASAFLHSKADPSKLSYEIGPPLYLGLVGGALIALGSAVHCATACRPNRLQRHAAGASDRQKDQRAGRIHRPSKPRPSPSYKMASVVTV
ncbi:claudin-10-like isoform 2-T2 [Menidia menidia]